MSGESWLRNYNLRLYIHMAFLVVFSLVLTSCTAFENVNSSDLTRIIFTMIKWRGPMAWEFGGWMEGKTLWVERRALWLG
jgi:hypothetical protein